MGTVLCFAQNERVRLLLILEASSFIISSSDLIILLQGWAGAGSSTLPTDGHWEKKKIIRKSIFTSLKILSPNRKQVGFITSVALQPG